MTDDVKRSPAEKPRQNRIVVGLDVLQPHADSLHEAFSFATLIPKTHVEVVWIPPLTHLAADVSPETSPTRTLTRRVNEIIEEFGVTRLNDAQIEVSVVIGEGSPAEALSRIAFMHDADMIIVGSHDRRSTLDELLIGSVAKKLVRLAPCPVLVMRPRATKALPEFDTPPLGNQAKSHIAEPHHYHHTTRNVRARENMPLLFPMGNS